MMASAGSCGEELGRGERGGIGRAEADPLAPVGFGRCEVRTTLAAPAAAPWNWYSVGCCGLEMMAVTRVAWAGGGQWFTPLPAIVGMSMLPTFLLG